MASRKPIDAPLWHHALNWSIAATAAIAIVSPNGSQPVALLVFLLVLPGFLFAPIYRYQLSRAWLIALLLPVITSIPLFIASDTGEALAAGARYFVAAMVFLGLNRFRFSWPLLLRAASVGGILAILFNLDQLGEMRVNWGVGFLDSGYISVMLLCLALAQLHLDKGRRWWRLLAVIGIVCLFIAVMKTGTRGAWPAMIFVFALQFFLVDWSVRRKCWVAVCGMAFLAIAAFTMPSVKERVSLTVYEFQSYYEENNHATSVGYRLDFWHIALRCFAESPVWGVSYQRRSEVMAEFIAENPESKTIGTDGRSSSHNEMLNALSKRGFIGWIAVLLLYLIPMRFFIRHTGATNSWPVRHLALAGCGLVLTMIICGITEAPMMNVRVGTSYCFLLVFLYHLVRRESTESQTARYTGPPAPAGPRPVRS